MKFITCMCVAAVIITQCYAAITLEQMQQTGSLMRKVCQPKNFVSDAAIDNMKNGIFADDRNLKCYIACIFKMANTVKHNTLDYEATIRQIDMLFPEELKAAAKNAIENCKSVPGLYHDVCEASFETAKCLHKFNPGFALP